MKLSTIFASALMVAVAFGFAACGNDDEDEKIPEVPTENEFTGTTVAWPASTPDQKFTSTDPVYTLRLDSNTKKATLEIDQAQFMVGMPQLDMVFPGIDYKILDNNVVLLSCANLVPESGGRPYPIFPITNLQGRVKANGTFDLFFECTPKFRPDITPELHNITFTGHTAD